MERIPNIEDSNKFEQKLVESEFADLSDLYEFKDNPNFVVRKWNQGIEDSREFWSRVEKGIRLMRELNDKYHIPVPVRWVKAKEKDGTDTLYTITAKIERFKIGPWEFESLPGGQKQSDPNQRHDWYKVQGWESNPGAKEIYIKKLNTLFINIANYFRDKDAAREEYLYDIVHTSQYAYGKKKGDDDNQFYLVDTDLIFGARGFGGFKHLLEVIEEEEKELNTTFDEPKRICQEILSEVYRKIFSGSQENTGI